MIGLAGAHRTGKTSLARESTRALGLPFAETSISDVFFALGMDPAEPMDFKTRFMVQSVILKTCIEKWSGYKGAFLSDRTPIDMLAYTMADIQGKTLDKTGEHLMAKYFADCINATNRHFGSILLVQPGIPIVPAPGKAALSRGYIEHLNTVIAGLLVRKDINTQVSFIRRETLDMQSRVKCVLNEHSRMIKTGVQERSQAPLLH
jgi:hypothetical protein